MSNEVSRCTSCREQKLHIREKVNKRITLFYFNTSSQVEKGKKKEMMDVNVRSVAAVTSLGGAAPP